MIQFERFTLSNGLKVLVHEDAHTAHAVVNVLYNVGARDEDPDKTGFAHLFEHLMFGGSRHIPNYDEEVQRAGEKIMLLRRMISRIITLNFLPQTLKRHCGWRATGCWN